MATERKTSQDNYYNRLRGLNHAILRLPDQNSIELTSNFIELNYGGIQKVVHVGDIHYSFDGIKIPVSYQRGEDNSFFEALKDIDSLYGSEKFKQQYFGKYSDKFEYTPSIRKTHGGIKLLDRDYVCSRFKFGNDKCTCSEACEFSPTLYYEWRGSQFPVICRNIEDVSKLVQYKSKIKVSLSISHMTFTRDPRNGNWRYSLRIEVDYLTVQKNLFQSRFDCVPVKRQFQGKFEIEILSEDEESLESSNKDQSKTDWSYNCCSSNY